MKTCPHCQAQIADEAEFCLYCMTPLKEKKWIPPTKRRPKGWLFVLGGIFHLTAILLLLLLWPRSGENSKDPVLQVTTTTGTTVQSTTTSSTTASTTFSTTTSSTTGSTTSSTTGSTTSSTTTATTTKPTTASTTVSTTLPTATNEVQYFYRGVQDSDDSHKQYLSSSDYITITGVKTPSINGVYIIPDMIDGKSVFAIAPNAFSGSGVTSVYIPSSVLNINDSAFNGCDLTDVYLSGHSLFIHNNAFPSGVTLHSHAICHNRWGSYYQTLAAKMGLNWQEWNDEQFPISSGVDSYGVEYYYRLSKFYDSEYIDTYQNPGDHITIVGVKTPSPSGEYHIPETIDGMTVAFIGNEAFAASGATTVYLPKTLIALGIRAFQTCAVTDVYFTQYINLHGSAFPISLGVLTVHCPKDVCSSPDRLYSDGWVPNGGTWKEWNGDSA